MRHFSRKKDYSAAMRGHSRVVGKEAVSLSLFLLFLKDYFAAGGGCGGGDVPPLTRGYCKMAPIHWMESKTRDVHNLVAVDMVSLSVSYKRSQIFVYCYCSGFNSGGTIFLNLSTYCTWSSISYVDYCLKCIYYQPQRNTNKKTSAAAVKTKEPLHQTGISLDKPMPSPSVSLAVVTVKPHLCVVKQCLIVLK